MTRTQIWITPNKDGVRTYHVKGIVYWCKTCVSYDVPAGLSYSSTGQAIRHIKMVHEKPDATADDLPTYFRIQPFKASKILEEDSKDDWKWSCLCPHCQADFTLPSNAPFLREKYKCRICKKSVSGIFLRGNCEQVKRE